MNLQHLLKSFWSLLVLWTTQLSDVLSACPECLWYCCHSPSDHHVTDVVYIWNPQSSVTLKTLMELQLDVQVSDEMPNALLQGVRVESGISTSLSLHFCLLVLLGTAATLWTT